MAPSASKANYKSYEAQARMVRAIVAAHPDVKWNYKDIVACYGSDMTEHALNHRFRRLRAQALIIREARERGLDMKDMMGFDDLPATQDAVDKDNIAKYFGQSTADGIQFQFRGIKKDADRLRQVEAEGGDVASCLSGSIGSGSGSVAGTPTSARATPSSRARKRSARALKRSSSDEDNADSDAGGPDDSFSDNDHTPSKRPRPGPAPALKPAAPRAAARKARATIASAAAQLHDADEPGRRPAFTPVSLFGPGPADEDFGDGEI